ncbi:hypothetical protein COO60DRAFT_1635822 [Scenedesmus sp. NREL 46B-D3]|nr:hypothetical protein COO60DRAFT_1635822 [Scenedesmus sp. NREL 46B-D3]
MSDFEIVSGPNSPRSCSSTSTQNEEAAGIGQAVDPHAVLLSGADAFATVLPPILCPEACRELVYTFQDCPGHGATLDPSGYIEAVVMYLLQQQEKDFLRLQGSVGGLKALSKCLTYGCLQHSITACVYFMPPHSPSRLDLALMAGLSKHVAVLPAVGKADTMTTDEAAACCQAVQHMLSEPAEYVPGLQPGACIDVYRPSEESFAAESSGLPLMRCTRPALFAAASDGVTSFLEVIASNEVYGLLDRSTDLFIGFCEAYEAAGRQLKDLAGTACAAAAQPLLCSRRSGTHLHATAAGGLLSSFKAGGQDLLKTCPQMVPSCSVWGTSRVAWSAGGRAQLLL